MDTIGLRRVTVLDMTLDKFTRTPVMRSPLPLDVSRGRWHVAQMRDALPYNIYGSRKTEDRLRIPLAFSVSLSCLYDVRSFRPAVVNRNAWAGENFNPGCSITRRPTDRINRRPNRPNEHLLHASLVTRFVLVVSVIEVNDYRTRVTAPALISVFLFLMRSLTLSLLSQIAPELADREFFLFSSFFFSRYDADVLRFFCEVNWRARMEHQPR